jgi:molybdenum cofactor biosynthesis enzyme MoaA
MGKDLKAENLTISLPNAGCNKNCEYCISKMTGFVDTNHALMCSNALKVHTLAKAAEITSVLFTGKGEPLLSLPTLYELAPFFVDFPLEIQTNGIALIKNPRLIHKLAREGFNVIAISIDSPNQFINMQKEFEIIESHGMITRVTFNLVKAITERISTENDLDDLVKTCKDKKVRQITFRRIVAPENPKDMKVVEWIKNNAPSDAAYDILKMRIGKFCKTKGKKIRTLNNGMTIWDVHGVSISHSDYCVQERDHGSDLRSLVFLEDGHLYTSWNSRASVLF